MPELFLRFFLWKIACSSFELFSAIGNLVMLLLVFLQLSIFDFQFQLLSCVAQ